MDKAMAPPTTQGDPQPAWAVATLFPAQGHWSERDYLELPTNRHVEYSDGNIEVLPMPTRLHQRIVAILYAALKSFVDAHKLGEVYFAPLPLHLWAGKYREPDVIFVRSGNEAALRGDYLEGADLVMEVVSPDDPDRDWVQKREEYAKASIPEYWVVDPSKRGLTVFQLKGDAYMIHGDYGPNDRATSALLPGFSMLAGDALPNS